VVVAEVNFTKAAEAWNHGMKSGITTAGCFPTHVVRQSDLLGDLMSRHPLYRKQWETLLITQEWS